MRSARSEQSQHTECSILDTWHPSVMHGAGGRSGHGGTINIHRTATSLLALLDLWHRAEAMQARVVTQLNIRQPGFDAE